MEIDEHGWLQENARDTPTPPTQPLVGPREDRRHSLGVGRVSTGLSYSSAYDKPEQVCGRTVTIVTVRPQQMLMNTRAKRRTAASRQPVLYAGVRPPDCRRRSRYAPLPRRSIARNNAAISGSVGVGTGIIAAVLADGPCRSPTPARLIPRARTSNVYSVPHFQLVDHHTAHGLSSQSVHASSSVASAVDRSS